MSTVSFLHDGAPATFAWIAGVSAALLLAAGIFFARSARFGRLATAVLIVVAAAVAAWGLLDRLVESERNAERRAWAQRSLDLTARSLAPGSPLACLDDLAGDVVEAECEKAVFASPAAVAASASYVAAKLALLAQGADLVRGDPAGLAPLQQTLEHDRFGFVAHVLARRYDCSIGRCEALALLKDRSRIEANWNEGAFDRLVAQHAGRWQAERAEATTAATGLSAAGVPAEAPPVRIPSARYDPPSAASIPPVSIMSPEPTTPPAAVAPGPASAPPPASVPIPRKPPPRTGAPQRIAPSVPAEPRQSSSSAPENADSTRP